MRHHHVYFSVFGLIGATWIEMASEHLLISSVEDFGQICFCFQFVLPLVTRITHIWMRCQVEQNFIESRASCHKMCLQSIKFVSFLFHKLCTGSSRVQCMFLCSLCLIVYCSLSLLMVYYGKSNTILYTESALVMHNLFMPTNNKISSYQNTMITNTQHPTLNIQQKSKRDIFGIILIK